MRRRLAALASLPAAGTLRGIVAMLAACAAFSVVDAMLKVLGGHFSPAQVVALRGWSSLPMIALYILWRREGGQVFHRGMRWRLHLMRGMLSVLMLVLFTLGLRTMGLGEAYTLSFVAPLLITLLAVPLLGERVQPRHWVAIAVGFGGVVVALRPDGEAFLTSGALAVLAAALCYALSNVLGRLASRTEPSSALVFWTTVSLAVGGGALAWPVWLPVSAGHLPAIAALAVAGFLAQLAISEAFRHGQAAAVAPFEYSALAWGLLLDWLIWRGTPDAWTLAGSAIIIASGLYLVRREAPRAAA